MNHLDWFLKMICYWDDKYIQILKSRRLLFTVKCGYNIRVTLLTLKVAECGLIQRELNLTNMNNI